MTKLEYHIEVVKHQAYVKTLILGGLVTVALLFLMFPILMFMPTASIKLMMLSDALSEKSKELQANKDRLIAEKNRLYP